MICQKPEGVHPDTPSNRVGGTGACRMCAAERQEKFKSCNRAARELYRALIEQGVPADAERLARAWKALERNDDLDP